MTEPAALPIFSGGAELAPLLDPVGGADEPELDPRRIVTLTCTEPGCGQEVSGPAGGRGSATWKLGTHRHNKHKKKADGSPDTTRKRPKPGEPSTEELAAQPVVAGVRSVAAAVGTGKSSVPTAADLTAGLGRGFQLLVQAGATLALETDPNLVNDPQGELWRDHLLDGLTITEPTAAAVMAPVGRLLAPTTLNKRYGRGLVENVDFVGAAAELAMLGVRWRTYLRQRAAQLPNGRPVTVLPSVPAYQPPPAAELPLAQVVAGVDPGVMQGVYQSVGGQQVLSTPPPTQGRVISAADVLAMRAGHGA